MADDAHILQFRSTHEYCRTTKYEGHPTIGDHTIVDFMVLAVQLSTYLFANRGAGMDTLFKWESLPKFCEIQLSGK